MKLSIIIVSYNTKEVIKECLDSIFSFKDSLSPEIIVVDNASWDGSAEFIKKEFPSVLLIPNKENKGYSKANNQGVKKSKGDYILFLNPDTKLRPQTLKTMVAFMDDHSEAGAATCKVQLENGTLDDASHRGFPTPWNSFCHFSGISKVFGKTKLFGGYNQGWKDTNSTHEIDALAGAFMMVRRSAGEEVGWWDEDFFFYGEDLDFCYNLKEKGWKIYFVADCSILHYKGVSGGIKKSSANITKASEETKKKVKAERFRAMRLFYEKHYKNKYPKLVTDLVLLGIGLKSKLS